MPDINSLMEKTKKKFKKSSYRPWNYLEEIEKEEEEKNQEKENVLPPQVPAIFDQSQLIENKSIPITQPLELKEPKKNLANSFIKETSFIANQINQEKLNSPLYSILRLSGHQKIIFSFVLEKSLSSGSLSSGIVTSEMLISMTNTSLSMINTSIQRLVDKKLLFRENGKRGRGGFYSFGLTQDVKDAAIEFRKLSTEVNKIENPFENDDLARMDNQKFSMLPKEWDEIDTEPLHHISFSRGHLVQLYKYGNIDVQTIQESIYHFAYDLEQNNKAVNITKSSPIGYFMGILKRSGLYNAPQNYESPKNKALREMLERKKIEKEKHDSMMRELINIAFDDWQAKLTQDEKDQLIPDEIKKSRLSGAKFSSLRTYFIENIWPQITPKEISDKID